MRDRMIFVDRASAQAVADKMAGWPDPHPIEVEDDGWVITVDPDDGARQPRYLRTDGFVR